MMSEEWRPVVGAEGRYEVSSHGAVRGVPRTTEYVDWRTGKLVSRPVPASVLRSYPHCISGHMLITVNRKKRYVHHLVLEAFVGPRPDGMEALHGDGDPSNNRVDNLRWGTRGANIRDAVRHGTHQMTRRSTCPRGHLLVDPNLVPSKLPTRQCLACDRARRVMNMYGHSEEVFRADADRRYRDIMAGVSCSA